MSVINLTSENFEKEVLKEEKPILIDFWASWCGPCKMMGPVVEQIAEDAKDVVKVCKLNIDEELNLATKYNVMSIPTMIIFKNGNTSKTFIGVTDKSEIIAEF